MTIKITPSISCLFGYMIINTLSIKSKIIQLKKEINSLKVENSLKLNQREKLNESKFLFILIVIIIFV